MENMLDLVARLASLQGSASDERDRKDHKERQESEESYELGLSGLFSEGTSETVSDSDTKEGKDRKKSSEVELQAAEMILTLSEQCQGRIRYNTRLLDFLQNSPGLSPKYLQFNCYPIYKAALAIGRPVSAISDFVQTLIRNNIFYYQQVIQRLQAGELDQAYLLLKTVVNGGATSRSAPGDRAGLFESERAVFVGMLSRLNPFKSSELQALRAKEYFSYLVQETPTNAQLPDKDKRKTFSVGFEQITALEITAINKRVEKLVADLDLVFKDRKDEVEKKGMVDKLQALARKTIPIVSGMHAKFCARVNQLFLEAQGSTEKNAVAILEAFCLLKTHIRMLRMAMQPLVQELEQAEAICREVTQLEYGILCIKNNFNTLLESKDGKERLEKVKKFLEGKPGDEASVLREELECIRDITPFFVVGPCYLVSLKEQLLDKFNEISRQYQALKMVVDGFNVRFAAYKSKLGQSGLAAPVPSHSASRSSSDTKAESESVQVDRTWILELPPLEEPKPLTKIEQTRLQVAEAREFNSARMLEHCRTLSEAERRAREERVRSIALSTNIKSQFMALYDGNFSHEALEKLVLALRQNGESISIEYPGSGSSHCTLVIRGASDSLEDFEGNVSFVEKAGSWKIQAKKSKNIKR